MPTEPIVTQERVRKICKNRVEKDDHQWYVNVVGQTAQMILRRLDVPIQKRRLVAALERHFHDAVGVSGNQSKRKPIGRKDVVRLFKRHVRLVERVAGIVDTRYIRVSKAYSQNQLVGTMLPQVMQIEAPEDPSQWKDILSERFHGKPFPDVAADLMMEASRELLTPKTKRVYQDEMVKALQFISEERIRKTAAQQRGWQ